MCFVIRSVLLIHYSMGTIHLTDDTPNGGQQPAAFQQNHHQSLHQGYTRLLAGHGAMAAVPQTEAPMGDHPVLTRYLGTAHQTNDAPT